ncbi:Hypothetical protein AT6N2_L0601 [Agrobacterium tumefaciens]|nr:Hypothetical protein AT6N2_L0601 [Agrobacterium tumefaciens]
MSRRFGKASHRREVIVRLRKILRLYRAAIALLGVATLDPTIRHAQFPGNADIVVLALRDVQNVVLRCALAFDESKYLFEEGRIGFFRARVIRREGGMKGIAKLLRKIVEGPALGIGHGDEAMCLCQFCHCGAAVFKAFPVFCRITQALAERPLCRQAKFGGNDQVDTDEIVRKQIGRIGIPGSAVERERFFATDLHAVFRTDRCQGRFQATFEIDEGAHHVEAHIFEVAQFLGQCGSPLCCLGLLGRLRQIILFPDEILVPFPFCRYALFYGVCCGLQC